MNSESILLNLSKKLLSNRLRGGTRLTRFLANRLKTFQSHRIEVHGGSLVIDLRNLGTHGLFVNSKLMTDEHKVMKRFVNAGDTVFDIGANAGLFTVWLSSLVGERGKVFAFEPNPAHRNSLENTISLLRNTMLLPVALSHREGTMDFFVPEDDTMGSLRNWTNNQSGNVVTKTCQTKTLDNLLNEKLIGRPNFIKCDIEGGETNCFKGAVSILNREDAPTVLFEMNLNTAKGYEIETSSAMDFLASLENPRYSFFFVEKTGELTKIESFAFNHGNVLAVPKSKL